MTRSWDQSGFTGQVFRPDRCPDCGARDEHGAHWCRKCQQPMDAIHGGYICPLCLRRCPPKKKEG